MTQISGFLKRMSALVLLAIFILSAGVVVVIAQAKKTYATVGEIPPAKISLSAEPKRIAFGQHARLSGRLRDNSGHGLAGRKVRIKVRGTVVKAVITKSRGVFKVRVKPVNKTPYRAVFEGDSGSMGARSKRTVVGINTPEQHVTDFFNAYKEQRLSEAYDLQPPENKARQSRSDYISLRSAMPISSFELQPTERRGDNNLVVPVEYTMGPFGAWIGRWEFEKNGRQWAAIRYRSSVSE